MSLTYEETIEKLHSKGMFYIDLGLERISEVLKNFDNPQNNLKFIHVAGTNGKGSFGAMMTSVLSSPTFLRIFSRPWSKR